MVQSRKQSNRGNNSPKVGPIPPAKRRHEEVADRLRGMIGTSLHPGDRLPTVRELMADFGVSMTSLRAAQAVLAHEGLIDIRHGSGATVVERPESTNPRRIGILSELELLDPRISPHFRATAAGIRACCAERGLETQLYVGHAEPGHGRSDEPTCPQFWSDIKEGKLAGAVILDTPATEAWYCRLQNCSIPMVGALTNYEANVDFEGITATAVRSLAEQGCRNLGLLTWHSTEPFLTAVKAAGVSTCDAWIRSDLDPAVRGTGWEEFREIWASRNGRPDGLVILDDMLYADAQLAILELGVQIPQDLRIATLVNRDASPPVRLPVTAFEIDPTERANMLVDMLEQRMRGEPMPPVTHHLSFRQLELQPGEEARSTEQGARSRECESVRA